MDDPLKSCNDVQPEGSERLGGGAIRLIALILAVAAGAAAQPVPGGISTIQQPSAGHAVFDASGNTYYLSGPPTAGAAQTKAGGGVCIGEAGGRIGVVPCPPASMIKVDPSGNQIWGTLLGGPGPDKGTALAIDANGNVAVTGTTSGQFPTTPGAAIASSTNSTAFAAKIFADGSKFLYATYLQNWMVSPSCIAMDAAGSAYIAGKTDGHVFVIKLSADGSAIIYTLYLGGSGADAATAIAVDSAGNAFVAGQTTSPDFPVTAGAFQQHLKGTQNNFLVRLDPSGNVLTSTYFGGSGSDSPSSIAVDSAGNIDLAGSTSSLDLPTTQGVMQPSAIVPPWNDFAPAGFVAQFAPDGLSLQWASYVMSSDLGFGRTDATIGVGVSALAVGPAGDIYIGGLTGAGFPVTSSAPVICFPGSIRRANGILAHLNSNGALLDATYLGNSAGSDVDAVGGLLPLAGGTVLIAWHEFGAAFASKIQFGSGGWTAPACLSTDVLNSATLDGSSETAPGELITLTGFGIGPDIGVVYQPDAQGNVPTQLGGVQVLFDGAPVPVLYAQSRQINAIAPVGLGTINTPHNVTVTYNTQQFGPALAYAIFGSPGIFRLQFGQSAQAAAINQDGTLNGPMNPASRGSVVAVWGTGYGQTNPPCPIGGLNVPYAAPLSPGVSALIYYVDPNSVVQLATVQYAGSAPTLVCGIVQINFQVPMDVAPGAFSFRAAIGEKGTVEALTSATIAVK
ncbi:MAG TPA: SBBP repeat-containing protein [Bryobacteraceae bacterium]|nr:SBBP repeat-containing protein [Bryobacteraceae bacterium]